MIAMTPGHRYQLDNFERPDLPGQELQFIHKEPGRRIDERLVTIKDGTTNEEVLEMMIDRISHLQEKFPCRENAIVITKLEESLMWLNKRTADRKARGVEGRQIK